MTLVAWKDDMSVGVAKVDEQHRRLVAMVNELHSSMRKGEGRQSLTHLFEGLADYTVTHFATEEELMLAYGYPRAEYQHHKEEHDKLMAQVKDLRAKAEAGQLTVTFELMQFLRDWLVNHILDTDKKMGPFFARKGVK